MKKSFGHLERFRVRTFSWSSLTGDRFGAFIIPAPKSGKTFTVICAPEGGEWEHVSVSLPNRCPTWEEMNLIKDLFFEEEETVVQFHPKKSEYKNLHPYCLHLFKHKDGHVLPPSILVAP